MAEEKKQAEPATSGVDGLKKVSGLFEVMGCACLNLGCLVLILSVLSLISMIVSGISNPLDLIKSIFGGLWCAAIGGCSK